MTPVTARQAAGWCFSPRFCGAYLIGSIPFAYLIVQGVTGEDITAHGTGNVGSMNVRRTTGSWGWFALAVLGDGLKGLDPDAARQGLGDRGPRVLAGRLQAVGADARERGRGLVAAAGPLGADGRGRRRRPRPQLLDLDGAHRARLRADRQGTRHRCRRAARLRLALLRRGRGRRAGRHRPHPLHDGRTGRGGRHAADRGARCSARPTGRSRCSWARVVYAAHHKRFIGMLHGKEPKLYINDRLGPRG